MNTGAGIDEFCVARGGPFYELQRQLGLIHENARRTGLRIAIFVGLAWGVPFLLSVAQGNGFGPATANPFLLDLGVWARSLVAVSLFILMERQVEESLRIKFAQFVRAPIIAPRSLDAAAEEVTRALRRRDSRIAELICLAIAVLASTVSLHHSIEVAAPSWAVQVSAGGNSRTFAAWWCLFISGPIFWFLLLRELWRHLVWSLLLRRVASLELRLVATHPDGMGGLAFIGEYPNAYATFIFALSCVLGAAVANDLLNNRLSASALGLIMSGWLVIVWGLFIFPLLAFRKPLSELKEATMLAFGVQATRYHRAIERRQLGRNVYAPDDAAAVTEADIPDPTKQFEAARKLSVLVVSRAALLPVSAAAVLPLAAAGVTVLPYKELLTAVKRLLLL